MTYPNVLVLDYLQTTGAANPELQLQAETYVATGYQRMLTFESDGGGFSLYGRGEGQVFLSAYGLMMLSDMSQVYPVDKALIDRTATWLLGQQQPGGAWVASDSRAGGELLGATSYVAWALIQAGYEDTTGIAEAIDRIGADAPRETDPYTLAIAANALAAYDAGSPATRAAVDALYRARIEDGDATYWAMGDNTSFMGASGASGSVEATALAASALMQARQYPDAVAGAMAYLIRAKDSWGTWNTTQATILSLKALLLASEVAGQAEGPATISVSLNNELAEEITIDEANADVVHQVTFEGGFSPGGLNEVRIDLEGGGNLMYQVTTRYYMPWNLVPPAPPGGELIGIDVRYDRTELAVNDEVTVNVGVRLNAEGLVKMALIDLGVPPGFTVLAEDLTRLVENGLIARYELAGRQIIIYLEDLAHGQPLTFSYRLRARFPMRAQTPPSRAYDYYNPGSLAMRAPLLMTVTD